MSTRRRAATGVLLLLLAALLTACAPGGNPLQDADPAIDAGFLLGVWHGAISPITFIVSLFTPDVGIYEVNNNGGWYDFGFLLGVSIAFGGGAGGAYAGRRR